MHSLFTFVLLSVVASTYGAIGPVADLYIGNGDLAPDGFTRAGVLAGSDSSSLSFPGPLITGNTGDTFQLNVANNLSDTTMLTSTSIHWHGFFQKGSSWADGPAGVTQCPIVPGNSFLYEFTATNQSGTFWYHSHDSTQYCDGLRGVIVVYDPDDPYLSSYDVDDESTVITLADWYHTVAPSAGLVPTADATLINGLGRTAGGDTVDLTVITVESGKRYRFRLVSISCDPNFTFSIDGHNMTVIEVDTVNTEQLVVDSIQIFAGQRYSFILTADQTVDNYWIRADPNVGTTGFDGGINSAILRYSGADEVEPTTNSSTSNLLAETSLVPLSGAAAPGTAVAGGADVVLNLDIAFDTTNFVYTVNDATFTVPTVPVLLQIMSGALTAADLLPAGSSYVLPANSVVEISIPGGSVGSPHPIHLHGHTFDVVRSAGSETYNYENPIKRDVVSIGESGDNVTIRFTTDNAGPWILHCHIDWHLEMGLAVVFAEDVATIESSNSTIPVAWDSLCPAYDAEFGTTTDRRRRREVHRRSHRRRTVTF